MNAPNPRLTDAEDVGSITGLLPGLRRHEPEAVASLWQRFYQPLVAVAASRISPAHCRHADGEDLAAEVLMEFCRLLAGPDADRRFPRLTSRTHVWRILVCLTVRAAFDHNTKCIRRATIVAGESAAGPAGVAGFAGTGPPTELAAAVEDLIGRLADPDHPEQGERLQAVARLLMAGHTRGEIARLLNCSEKNVWLKVELIRRIWRNATGEVEIR